MTILDTNVVSELLKPTPSDRVVRWLEAQPAPRLFTTTITVAEILYGVELLPTGKRRTGLRKAIEAIFSEDFDGRILPFDFEAARAFSTIAAARRAMGRPMSQHDAQIAAIGSSRGAALATRNTRDFADCGVTLLNPWGGR